MIAVSYKGFLKLYDLVKSITFIIAYVDLRVMKTYLDSGEGKE